MKRIVFLLALLLLLAACAPEPEPTPVPLPTLPVLEVQEAQLFMPFVAYQPYPPCKRSERLGIAWLAGRRSLQDDLDNFCASWFFNSSGHNFADLYPGEIPIGWCDTNRNGLDYGPIIATVPRDYTGYAIAMNEPGIDQAQCWAPTPEDAARIFVWQKQYWPAGAQLVTPNVIVQRETGANWSAEYLEKFLLEVDRLTSGKSGIAVIGIHIYGVEDTPARQIVDWTQAAMDRAGYGDRPLWVTEYGVFRTNSWSADRRFMATRTNDLLSDPRVERVFGYTVRGPQNAWGWTNNDGSLTPAGRGWFDGLMLSGEFESRD